jgi:hypothetical protein
MESNLNRKNSLKRGLLRLRKEDLNKFRVNSSNQSHNQLQLKLRKSKKNNYNNLSPNLKDR